MSRTGSIGGVLTAPCAVRTTHVACGVAILRRVPGIAVVGPGAVGATFAAAAERTGHTVALCGRRAAPAPVVELPDGERQELAGPVRADPSRGAPADWVLLAVKTHQTAGAADWLPALCGPGTVVAVLQNGVEHRALVAPFAGPAHVLPAIVWCPSEAVSPARVRQRGPARLSVPDEPAGARSPRSSTRRSTARPTSTPRPGASSASTRSRR